MMERLMSLRSLPNLKQPNLPQGFSWEPPSRALAIWSERPLAAEDTDATISIYEPIGADPWTGEGVTAKRISAALRSIGKRPVTVNINSPGGYADDGVAIYNLLADHPAKVTVKIMGIAASAASIIAMAGDEVLMGIGTLLMVHNGWGLVIGNRHDFRDAADVFEKFDRSMADIYAARTGSDVEAMMTLMDGKGRAADGTWMTPAEAVEMRFADGTFESASQEALARAELPSRIAARRRLEAALAAQGMPRSERFALLNELTAGERDAAGNATRDAGEPTAADLMAAIATLKR